MTNTAATQSPIPATETGIVCGHCTRWTAEGRVQVRHANRDAVLACFTSAQNAAITPVASARVIRTGRYVAVCRVPACERRHEMAIPFVLKCTDHSSWETALVEADGIVRTPAAELVATVTTARCDLRCIHAHGALCRCSCGGRNHGVGNRNVAVQPA